jgi:hypothetical protein
MRLRQMEQMAQQVQLNKTVATVPMARTLSHIMAEEEFRNLPLYQVGKVTALLVAGAETVDKAEAVALADMADVVVLQFARTTLLSWATQTLP